MTSPTQPGDTLLGKYRVERVLGQGGMGVVVAARHIELGELFAIKFLLPAALAQPDAVERFLREARASARLKGEHVVKVQDVGRLPDGLPYMVMEHLSGSDLKDVVLQRGPAPVTDALTYVLQACEAVAEAHSLGIVHRDLKPANMFLIRRPNGSPCVKVLDFGISKQTEAERAEQHALTRTGMVLGSPIYMSPEQMMRTQEADPRGDIWSMGVVLYQLLTGTVPFLADVLTELVGKVLQEEPLPPSHHRPDIPPAVDAIVMTCLQKRRENRYQTVVQLMDALRAALAVRTAADPLHPAMPLTAAPLQAAAPLRPAVPFTEGRRALPSQPELNGGTVPLPAVNASFSSTGPRVAAITGSDSTTDPAAAAITSPAAQTGQAWGTTGSDTAPIAEPKRTGLVVGAVIAVVVLIGGVVLAALQYRGDAGTATAASTAPVTTAITAASSAMAAASSDTAPPLATGSGVPSASDTPPVSPTPSVAPPTPSAAKDAPEKPTSKPGVKPITSAAQEPVPTIVPVATPVPPTAQVTAVPTVKKHDSMY